MEEVRRKEIVWACSSIEMSFFELLFSSSVVVVPENERKAEDWDVFRSVSSDERHDA